VLLKRGRDYGKKRKREEEGARRRKEGGGGGRRRNTKVGGSWMLSTTLRCGLYLLSIGFADAKIDVRDGNEQTIPAWMTCERGGEEGQGEDRGRGERDRRRRGTCSL
jgi:hypothetical protein